MTIYRFLILFLITICCTITSSADDNKSYKCEGTTYSSTGRVKSNSESIATGFTWSDSKGKEYPIYMSNSGSCYIIKVSAKTNKEYKQYLKPEISQDICNKLSKEYQGKKND